MSEKFPHLFSPLQVGTHTYRNRIEASPTMFAFCHLIEFPGGVFPPRLPERAMRMLENRAKGGCASVTLGECAPNNTNCKRFPFEPDIDFTNFDDPWMPTIQATADVIKKHGAVAIAELVCSGNTKPDLGDGIAPLGPSAFLRDDGVQVKAFDQQSIDDIIQDHVNACRWFWYGGWDGIMIHAGHGWLPAQFLSKSINHRTDCYGGSLENRSRFTVELLRKIREAMGKNFIIEMRVSGEEHIPNGITIDETVEFCKQVEPYVDLIHVTSGNYYSTGRTLTVTTALVPHGINVENAAQIKAAVNVPVTVVGGINSPEFAEQAIAEGKVDMVTLARQLIADPNFANKAQNGQEDRIRRCIRCGRCYPGPPGEHETERKGNGMPKLGTCTINPYDVWPASHHKVFPEEMPVPEASRKVLVVGGGCGGMQAAITAAERGHRVTLVEKEDRLGGLLNFTKASSHKQDIWNFKELLIRELDRLGVEVRLNCEATPELVRELSAEALILAVGSCDLVPRIPGIENAIPALSVYYDNFAALGKRTIVLGGGLVGCEAAVDYADHGIQVTVVERFECLVPDGAGIYRTAVLDRLDAVGAVVAVNSTVTEVGKDYVAVSHPDGTTEVLLADSVVNAMGRVRNTAPLEQLRNALPEIQVFEIGDCKQVAQIGDAVSAGWTAAMEIC